MGLTKETKETLEKWLGKAIEYSKDKRVRVCYYERKPNNKERYYVCISAESGSLGIYEGNSISKAKSTQENIAKFISILNKTKFGAIREIITKYPRSF